MKILKGLLTILTDMVVIEMIKRVSDGGNKNLRSGGKQKI